MVVVNPTRVPAAVGLLIGLVWSSGSIVAMLFLTPFVGVGIGVSYSNLSRRAGDFAALRLRAVDACRVRGREADEDARGQEQGAIVTYRG